jgi:hypothetical protein
MFGVCYIFVILKLPNKIHEWVLLTIPNILLFANLNCLFYVRLITELSNLANDFVSLVKFPLWKEILIRTVERTTEVMGRIQHNKQAQYERLNYAPGSGENSVETQVQEVGWYRLTIASTRDFRLHVWLRQLNTYALTVVRKDNYKWVCYKFTNTMIIRSRPFETFLSVIIIIISLVYLIILDQQSVNFEVVPYVILRGFIVILLFNSLVFASCPDYIKMTKINFLFK